MAKGEIDTLGHLRLCIRDAPLPFPEAKFPLPPKKAEEEDKTYVNEQDAYHGRVQRVLATLGMLKVQVAYDEKRARDLQSNRVVKVVKKNYDTDAVVAGFEGKLLYMRCHTGNVLRLREALAEEAKSPSGRKIECIGHRWDGSERVEPL